METQKAITRTRRQHWILWVLALGIISAGYHLSAIHFMNAEWLSRSGCVIVVLGIWSGLGGILQEHVLLSRLQFRRRTAISRAQRKHHQKSTDSETLENEIAEIEKVFQEKSDELSQALRLSVGIMELSLLMTGTLLWGFGDILFDWLVISF